MLFQDYTSGRDFNIFYSFAEPCKDLKSAKEFLKINKLKKDYWVPMTKTQQTFVKEIIPMIRATKTPGYTPANKPVTRARRVTNIQLAKVRGLATQHLGTSYTKLISQIRGYKR